MVTLTEPDQPLNEYERAVCYYTLPRVVSPLTLGLIIAYGVCLLEAIAVLLYGLIWENDTWTYVGAYALGGIVVFGMLSFTARAFLNDLRKRAALAAARHSPEDIRAADVPDPFSGHALLRHPVGARRELFACVHQDNHIEYYVETSKKGVHWRVRSMHDEPLFEILAVQRTVSFTFSPPVPAQLKVFRAGREIASIMRKFHLRGSLAHIFDHGNPGISLRIQNGCIFQGDRMVGRVYSLRKQVYLDMEKQLIGPGILSYFITLR